VLSDSSSWLRYPAALRHHLQFWRRCKQQVWERLFLAITVFENIVAKRLGIHFPWCLENESGWNFSHVSGGEAFLAFGFPSDNCIPSRNLKRRTKFAPRPVVSAWSRPWQTKPCTNFTRPYGLSRSTCRGAIFMGITLSIPLWISFWIVCHHPLTNPSYPRYTS
jgi:hypothetical protein